MLVKGQKTKCLEILLFDSSSVQKDVFLNPTHMGSSTECFSLDPNMLTPEIHHR